MTYYELLKCNAAFLRLCKRNGILIDDVEAIEIYERYKEMEAQGMKKLYIREELARKYNISTRTIYNIRDRFEATINI